VLARPTEGQHDEAVRAAVNQLAAHVWTDAHQAVRGQHVLDAFYNQGQLALEDEVDLFLVLVRVDAKPLARLQHDQVHPERAHAEFAPQRLKTLAAIAIERAKRNIRTSHQTSICADATSRPLARVVLGATSDSRVQTVLSQQGRRPILGR